VRDAVPAAPYRTMAAMETTTTGAVSGGRPTARWRVLGFGRDPDVSAAIEQHLRAQGIDAHTFVLTDDARGDARLTGELRRERYDGVAIGGFINGQNPDVRPTMETTCWFNRILNIIHRDAPGAQIILVRDPADALPAIRRVLS
jgi:hypothetical protein